MLTHGPDDAEDGANEEGRGGKREREVVSPYTASIFSQVPSLPLGAIVVSGRRRELGGMGGSADAEVLDGRSWEVPIKVQ